MTPRTLAFPALVGIVALTFAPSARADDAATAFVHAQQDQLRTLLHQPASPARDAQVTSALSRMVDYDAMTHRAFGEPCAAETPAPACKDHWAELTDAQKSEIAGLLRRLVEKNYQKNIGKTLDYDVAYQGASPVSSDSVVHTEASSISKPRDPAVLVDYVVHGTPGAFRVVDVVTEGSSLTKSYYDQFHRMLTNPEQGYAYVVKKLNDKLSAS
jgi:phospholipid transport system substrate-binding protein